MTWFAKLGSLILIDQLSKWFAIRSGWSIFYNENFAFSLPLPTALMYLIYAVVLGLMVNYLVKSWHALNPLHRNAWCLVLAGGLSNVCERLVAGNVVDFVPVPNGMINFADIFIFIGLVLIIASDRAKKKLNVS